MTAAPRPRVVVIDSGIDPQHPMVRGRGTVLPGAVFDAHGRCSGDPCRDELGHGTAVAATILQFAADVELISLRVFEAQPVCEFQAVLHAIEHALSLLPRVLNLSLGTTSLRHRRALEALVLHARRQNTAIVTPATYGGLPSDPGNLAGVEAVVADPNVLPMLPELRPYGGRLLWFASPLPPRDADGGRRLVARGDSLAVACVSGCLVRTAK